MFSKAGFESEVFKKQDMAETTVGYTLYVHFKNVHAAKWQSQTFADVCDFSVIDLSLACS